MSARESELKVECPSCHEQNERDMSFCLFCGKSLKAQLTATAGNACPRCGRFDQLNSRFCIFCSADTTGSATPIADVRKFSWEVELPRLTQEIAPGRVIQAQVAGQTMAVSLAALVAAVAGSCLALVISPVLQRAAAQSAWPNQSLIIYTQHPHAQVTIEPTQQARNFTLGKVGEDGALCVSGLPNQHYMVKVSAPGYQTSMIGLQDEVEIDPLHPTAIGYPTKLELLPKHTSDNQ